MVMKNTLVITEYKDKMMGFVYEDMKLITAHLFSDRSLAGNIYVARVDKLLKNINAAFLDIGIGDEIFWQIDEKDNIIYTKKAKASRVSIGDQLLVMIDKDAAGSKKAVVKTELSLGNENIIINTSGEVGVSHKIYSREKRDELKNTVSEVISEFTGKTGYDDVNQKPAEDFSLGAIIRTSAESIPAEELKKEASVLIQKMDSMIKQSIYLTPGTCLYKKPRDFVSYASDVSLRLRNSGEEEPEIITDIPEVYDTFNESTSVNSYKCSFYNDSMLSLSKVYNLEKNMERALSRRVYLNSGAELVIDRTEAMTVIDVNSGKAVKGNDRRAFLLKLNKEAATAVAKELRLRNISGIIIIDFVNMEDSEDIRELVHHLKAEISKDDVRCTFVDVTPLGLIELTRKKTGKSLYDLIG